MVVHGLVAAHAEFCGVLHDRLRNPVLASGTFVALLLVTVKKRAKPTSCNVC
jgi:hypothetical protein